MTILAVHTNPKQLELLTACIALVFAEHAVIPFSDPLLAVQYGFHNPVDLLFTAVKMRGLSGDGVARGIRQKNEKVKVCYVTGSKQEEESVLLPDLYFRPPITENAVREIMSALEKNP